MQNIDTKRLYKELLEIADIKDPKVATKLTNTIATIDGTLTVCDDENAEKVSTLIIAYLRVLNQARKNKGV